jgi:hypothetical protein
MVHKSRHELLGDGRNSLMHAGGEIHCKMVTLRPNTLSEYSSDNSVPRAAHCRTSVRPNALRLHPIVHGIPPVSSLS